MAKTFLRSGKLDAVLALGENGQPVYASALQIRETLRLRRQTTLANVLAIPQPNEKGDRLDWYAPVNGRVKSWLAASDSERRNALQQLTLTQQDFADLSNRAREAGNPAMRLFGALLSKSFQFPDQQYVYLVDGKPVITFWGFVDLDARSRPDPLDCLRATLHDELPALLAPDFKRDAVEPEPVPEALPAEPSLPEPVLADTAPAPVAPEEPAPVRRRVSRRLWWVVPPVAAAVAAAITFAMQSPAPEASAPESVATPRPAQPPVVVKSVSQLAQTLPVTTATVTAPPEPATPAAPVASEAAAPVVPAKADDLVMPAEAVRVGSTKFLDGRWRVTLLETKLPTGKPPSLRYQFKNGQGRALVTQGDGIRCQAEITTGLMSSGNLVIRSRYPARCSDGSRYRMPQLYCKQGEGAASCEARYNDEQVFPMTIKRESK
ncbi:SrfA family protein [[Erwinia] mediterraneensis]|uniref:SrfA family protein n=1 Tax=[Erwinia] mediterraneensis TaxID=2161819 RepID=UPI00102F3538|nr:SrfA family protein [[Erwinia] mediterraneensis]